MTKFKPLPAVETLREHLHYDPTTGELVWLKATSNRAKPGSGSGGTSGHGYCRVALHGSSFFAHRLAWLMHHGVDPGELEVDHRDGNRSNNRIENLRLATGNQNHYNTKTRSDNTSGVKGVTWSKARKKWQAQVKVSGKKRALGRFVTIEGAEAAVRAAREALHGEFAHHG